MRRKGSIKKVLLSQALLPMKKHLLPVEKRSLGQAIGIFAYTACVERARRAMITEAMERDKE